LLARPTEMETGMAERRGAGGEPVALSVRAKWAIFIEHFLGQCFQTINHPAGRRRAAWPSLSNSSAGP